MTTINFEAAANLRGRPDGSKWVFDNIGLTLFVHDVMQLVLSHKESLTVEPEPFVTDAQIDKIADDFEDSAGRIRVDQVFAFARAIIAADRARAADPVQQARHQLLNTPELHSFSEGVTLEALHQRERWGTDHDAGKAPADWFWLVGYLAGKALHAQTSGNAEKALHHTISTAAALANWHAAITGEHSATLRPA